MILYQGLTVRYFSYVLLSLLIKTNLNTFMYDTIHLASVVVTLTLSSKKCFDKTKFCYIFFSELCYLKFSMQRRAPDEPLSVICYSRGWRYRDYMQMRSTLVIMQNSLESGRTSETLNYFRWWFWDILDCIVLIFFTINPSVSSTMWNISYKCSVCFEIRRFDWISIRYQVSRNRSRGNPFRLVTPDEIKQLCPIVDESLVRI